MSNKKLGILIVIIVVVLGILVSCSKFEDTANPDVFAKCLTAKGAKMYGSEWCGACQNQKALFADDFQYVDYVDCPENQVICSEAGITAYPTWIIGDKKHVGGQSLETLASLTGCI